MKLFKPAIFIIVVVVWAGFHCSALPSPQSSDTAKAKKKFYLTFNIDVGVQQLYFHKKDLYEGEYLSYNFAKNTAEWIWQRDEEIEDGTSKYKMRSYQLMTLIMPWKRLNVGLDYHLMLLLEETAANLAEGAIPNFSIAVVAGYEFRFPKTKGFFIFPTASFGTYQSNDSYQGPGRELHASFKLATGYIFKDKWALRLFIADNLYRYKEKTVSPRFGRPQIEKIDMDIVEWGFGIGYRFSVTPD